MEPIVSVPRATETSPPPTTAPEPPLDPPHVRVRSCGFLAMPKNALLVVAPSAASAMLRVATMSAPAPRSARTTGASSDEMMCDLAPTPADHAVPRTAMLALTATDTPCNAPGTEPGNMPGNAPGTTADVGTSSMTAPSSRPRTSRAERTASGGGTGVGVADTAQPRRSIRRIGFWRRSTSVRGEVAPGSTSVTPTRTPSRCANIAS